MNKKHFGLIGILGSVLLFVGDMFLYGNFGNASEFTENIQIVAQNASQLRLFTGGILGPAGAMLYIAGFWHIYLNTKRYSRFASVIIFLSFTCMMFFGGTYHTLWTVRMLLYKYNYISAGHSDMFVKSFNSFMDMIFNISLSIGYVGVVFLVVLIIFRKSIYPRWVVFINPGILILLAPLVKRVPYPFSAILFGGYINIVFFIFLTVSVITTWKKKEHNA